MPWTAKPSDDLIDHVRAILRVNPDVGPTQLLLDITNNTGFWDHPEIGRAGQSCHKDLRLVQIGWAMSIVDSERKTLVTGSPKLQLPTVDAAAPTEPDPNIVAPCDGKVSPPTVDIEVADHVAAWLRRLGKEDWTDSDVRPLELRLSVTRVYDDSDRVWLTVEVEERPFQHLTGPLPG